MIIDLSTINRDYIYISHVYRYIEQFGAMGHQAGRKIGDMLELVTLGILYKNQELSKHLLIEPKLEGFTTAGHKVEFGLFEDKSNMDTLFGSIECKKVGVEVSSKSKKVIEYNSTKPFVFSNKWLSNRILIKLKYASLNDTTVNLEVYNDTDLVNSFNLTIGDTIKFVLTENEDIYILSNETLFESTTDNIRVCKYIQLKKITPEKITLEISNCLTGPQTIEKAKQASLVAMDLRKKIDGHWGTEDVDFENRKMTSILVLTEFSHWEEKSLNVIKTCLDYNLVVPDEVIIECFKRFNSAFNLEDSLNNSSWNKITKNLFKDEPEIQQIIFDVIDYFEGKVLYDIETNNYVTFNYNNNKLDIVTI